MIPNSTINFLKIIISLVALSLFVVPLSYGFFGNDPTNEMDGGPPTWNPQYLYSDETFLMLVAPFYLLWAIYISIRHVLARRFLIFLLLVMTAFYSLLSYFSASFPMQDYSPGIGMLLLFSLFPLLMVLAIMEYYAGEESVLIVDEGVLDEGEF